MTTVDQERQSLVADRMVHSSVRSQNEKAERDLVTIPALPRMHRSPGQTSPARHFPPRPQAQEDARPGPGNGLEKQGCHGADELSWT